jgi:hypothetical protein
MRKSSSDQAVHEAMIITTTYFKIPKFAMLTLFPTVINCKKEGSKIAFYFVPYKFVLILSHCYVR